MVKFQVVSLIFAASIGFSALARAEGGKSGFERLREGHPVTTVAPIFSQLLRTSLPPGFELISFEKTNGPFYIRESVLNGETVENWSQMVTTTGMKDLALKPEVTAKIVLDRMVQGFRGKCPFSFNTLPLSESANGAADTAVAVISCGASPAKGARNLGEVALIVVIKGQTDFYTVQWAERAPMSNVPVPIDAKKWSDRLKQLGPVKLCPIVPGEKAPYLSCVGVGQKKPA